MMLISTRLTNSQPRNERSISFIAWIIVCSLANGQTGKFQIINKGGAKLPLATVIKNNTALNRLDSSSIVTYSKTDEFEIRHIGCKTQYVKFPFPSHVIMQDSNIVLGTVYITPDGDSKGILGNYSKKNRKLYPVFWGGIHEVVIPIINNLDKKIKLNQAYFSIHNEGIKQVGLKTYAYYFVKLYTKLNESSSDVLHDSIKIMNTILGDTTICVDLEKLNIRISPKDSLFLGLLSYSLTGGEFDLKRKKDVSLETNIDYKNTIRWGSWVNYQKYSNKQILYLRNRFNANIKWYKMMSEYTPAFYVTYSVVTD